MGPGVRRPVPRCLICRSACRSAWCADRRCPGRPGSGTGHGARSGRRYRRPAAPASPQAPQIPQVPDNQKKVVASPGATKDDSFGPTVKEIEVIYSNGIKSVNRSVILSNMRTTVGQPYSPAAVEEDVKNLYATGLFVNLRISDEPEGDGVKVIVIVQPKPLIKEILITGAGKISDKKIRKQIKSKPGDPLNEQQIAEDARRSATTTTARGSTTSRSPTRST